MITSVNSAQTLVAALKSATSGDIIQLASGDYSKITIQNLSFSGAGVTITSQNSADPATLNGMVVRDSQGLHFSNLKLNVDPTGGSLAYVVQGSKDVHFDRVDVHGSLDGDASNDVGGIMLRESSNVSVTNSEFQQLLTGISHLDSDHVVISGNDFHHMRLDGVRGGGTSYIEVSNNHFTEFARQEGDHPDAIQFWTSNTTSAAHHITVTGNIVVRGEGSTLQGVFMRDEVGGLAFQDVTISDNLIVGGAFNGIAVLGVDGIEINNNRVLGYDDQKSWIRLEDAKDATLINNTAQEYNYSRNLGVAEAGNKVLAATDANSDALTTMWMQSRVGQASLYASELGQQIITKGVSLADASSAKAASAPMKFVTSYTGDNKANKLTGSSGDDIIDGRTGADTMTGLDGDDVYVVTDAGDVVVEAANQGVDTVRTDNSTYKLGANLENLELTATKWVQNVSGNEAGNLIVGNTFKSKMAGEGGNDTLVGTGGLDTMTGGAGQDVFRFDSIGAAPARITDFVGGQDELDLRPLLKGYAGSNPIVDHWVSFAKTAAGVDVLVDVDGAAGAKSAVIVATLAGATLPGGGMMSDWLFH